MDSNNFSVTLSSGSSVTITSQTRNQLSTDITTDVVSNTCNDSTSSLSLSYNGVGTITNTITPGTTICSTVVPVVTNTTTSNSGGKISVSGVAAPTNPISLPLIVAPSVSIVSHDISSGSEGDDILNLQVFLNKQGFVIAKSGIGSPGNESKYFGEKTRQAVILLQKKYGIIPALGNVGPATRELINSLNSKAALVIPSPASVQPTVLIDQSSFTKDIKIGDSGTDVILLQKYLNTHGFIISLSGPGSPGNETDTFGSLTKIALIRFQTSKGISATGYFGPRTRAMLK